MFEVVGNMWEFIGSSVIVITTNGSVTKDGRAVMGRGAARQAIDYFPDIAENLGKKLAVSGNHVFDLENGLVTFPVEETAWSLPDPRIIARSARELRELVDSSGWQLVVVPRPACGGGGLVWQEIKPLLEPWFDERFMVISQQ